MQQTYNQLIKSEELIIKRLYFLNYLKEKYELLHIFLFIDIQITS